MSCKKDRFDKRRYRKLESLGAHGPPSGWKRWQKMGSRRFLRARNKQLLREGVYDQFQPYRQRYGWW